MSDRDDEIREYYAAEQDQIRQNYEDEHQRQMDDQAREDQEQQDRQWRDWDDEAAANLTHQQREQADRNVHQRSRSNDDAANRVGWLIGALIGLALILPVMAATFIWKAVVWSVRWMLRKR